MFLQLVPLLIANKLVVWLLINLLDHHYFRSKIKAVKVKGGVEVLTRENEWREEEKTLKVGAYAYSPRLHINDIVCVKSSSIDFVC